MISKLKVYGRRTALALLLAVGLLLGLHFLLIYFAPGKAPHVRTIDPGVEALAWAIFTYVDMEKTLPCQPDQYGGVNIEELWRSLKPGRREDPQDPSSGLWIWNGRNWRSRSRFVDEWDKDYVVSMHTNCTASTIEMTIRSCGPDGTMATKDDSIRTVPIYLDLLKK